MQSASRSRFFATLIGLGVGVISAETYGTIIIMALLTAIVTPLILNWTLPSESF